MHTLANQTEPHRHRQRAHGHDHKHLAWDALMGAAVFVTAAAAGIAALYALGAFLLEAAISNAL